ncbi:hypothetical protein ACFVW2_38185, partial [Streptomyces sp. NPDC058171]
MLFGTLVRALFGTLVRALFGTLVGALYGACTECSTGHCEALFSALAAVLCRALRRAPLWAVPHARSSGVVS